MRPDSGLGLPRLPALAVLVLCALVGMALRVAWLGLRAGEPTVYAAPHEIAPQRGAVWDRDGDLLATETYDRYEIVLDREACADEDQALDAAAAALDRPAEELRSLARTQAARWITLEWNAWPEAAAAIEGAELGCLTAIRRASRAYPLGEMAAHLTGFVDLDQVGHFGVEEAFDAELRGLEGRRPGVYRTDPAAYLPPRDGADIVLTIDRDIQAAAHTALSATLAEQSAEGGSVVVIAPDTGAVLASVSLPSYDPNRYGAYDFGRYPDPVVSSIYPPGSVVKPLTLASAMDAGLLTPDTTYEDEASYRFGGITVFNQDRAAHGTVSMRRMLELSLNVGAAHVAETLGAERFYGSLLGFGFGRATGIELAGEVEGLVHLPGEDTWSESHFALSSFGQGMATTPLQVAVAMATLANDGRRMRPRVVAGRLLPDGRLQESPPTLASQAIAPETARRVRRMLEDVVEETATRATVPGYRVGGKTGTSEVPGTTGEEKDTIASFAGFLPVDEPRIVVLAKVDRPRVDSGGSAVAAPLFSAVAAEAAEILDIPPDDLDAWRLAQEIEEEDAP